MERQEEVVLDTTTDNSKQQDYTKDTAFFFTLFIDNKEKENDQGKDKDKYKGKNKDRKQAGRQKDSPVVLINPPRSRRQLGL